MQYDGVFPASGRASRKWFCADLPMLDYRTAWDLQVRLVAARKGGIIGSDVLILLEHEPVFTLGRRGGRENLTVSEAFLEEAGVCVLHVERGGNITFHGPGQLVGYPILDLQAAGLSVTGYVERLEEVMIRTAAEWGVVAERNSLNRGVWAGGRKLGSVGIAIRRGISFHGFAFNVKPSLKPFGWINPCGLKGIEMTSLERELSRGSIDSRNGDPSKGLIQVLEDGRSEGLIETREGGSSHSLIPRPDKELSERPHPSGEWRPEAQSQAGSLSMQEVRERLKANIVDVFQVELAPTTLAFLQEAAQEVDLVGNNGSAEREK